MVIAPSAQYNCIATRILVVIITRAPFFNGVVRLAYGTSAQFGRTYRAVNGYNMSYAVAIVVLFLPKYDSSPVYYR